MTKGHQSWEQLAQDMENHNYTTDADQTLVGEGARAEGRAMLYEAFGTDDLGRIDQIRRGRPSLARQSTHHGESHMLRVRITPDMDEALVKLSRKRGTTKSETVRALLDERLTHPS